MNWNDLLPGDVLCYKQNTDLYLTLAVTLSPERSVVVLTLVSLEDGTLYSNHMVTDNHTIPTKIRVVLGYLHPKEAK